MTIKKAIEVLKDLRVFDNDCDEDCEALDIAIRALENLHLIQYNVYAIDKFLKEAEGKADGDKYQAGQAIETADINALYTTLYFTRLDSLKAFANAINQAVEKMGELRKRC